MESVEEIEMEEGEMALERGDQREEGMERAKEKKVRKNSTEEIEER